ncbi:hypothetical protein GC173_06745 [bacterium]|nr:hypothetical protein [bacterium]
MQMTSAPSCARTTGAIALRLALALLCLLPVATSAQRLLVAAEVQVDDQAPVMLSLMNDTVTTVGVSNYPGRTLAWTQADFLGQVDTANLSIGPHMLSARLQDDTGRWSDQWSTPPNPYSTTDRRTRQFFRVTGEQRLTTAEYIFTGVPFDEDVAEEDRVPGDRLTQVQLASRSGVPVELPADGIWDGELEEVAIALPTAELSPGYYFVYTRIQDQDGLWSLWYEGAFTIAPKLAIQAAEIIADPAAPLGSGIAMGVSGPDEAGDHELMVEKVDLWDFSRFPRDARPRLYIRSQDNLNFHVEYPTDEEPDDWDRGRWSDPTITVAEIDRCPTFVGRYPELQSTFYGQGQRIPFSITLDDADRDPLPPVLWTVNGEVVEDVTGTQLILQPSEVGTLIVTATAAPGTHCEINDVKDQRGSTARWEIFVLPCNEEECGGDELPTIRDKDKLLIIAGGGAYPLNGIANQTRNLAEFAFRVAERRGYLRSEVLYLSAFPTIPAPTELDPLNTIPNPNIDNRVDFSLNDQLVRDSIVDWARDARRLIILMIDHGEIVDGDVQFILDGRTNAQYPSARVLTGTRMAEILLEAQGDDVADPLRDVVVIGDMCYAAGFMQKLVWEQRQFRRRYMIASTTSDRLASFSGVAGQMSFTGFFLSSAMQGGTLRDAFFIARESILSLAIPEPPRNQNPQLDDDGDGVMTGLDGNFIGTQVFGKSGDFGNIDLRIEEISPNRVLARAESINVYAVIAGEPEAVRVYVRHTARNVDEGQPITGYADYSMNPPPPSTPGSGSTQTWTLEIPETEFDFIGEYRILFVAEKQDPLLPGLSRQSVPVIGTVQVENGISPDPAQGAILY